jgi:hypothetical protein
VPVGFIHGLFLAPFFSAELWEMLTGKIETEAPIIGANKSGVCELLDNGGKDRKSSPNVFFLPEDFHWLHQVLDVLYKKTLDLFGSCESVMFSS